MRSRSSSTSSSKSLPADNIQIFVKVSDGKTIPLNVRLSNSISDLLNFLSASTTLPTDVRLLHAGRHLSPSSTVGDLGLAPSSTLHLLSPLRGGTAPSSETSSSTTAATMTATIPTSLDAPADHSAAITPATSGTATPTNTTPRSTGTSTPTSTTRRSNKPRCSHPPCKSPAQPIVGHCGFCQKRFCGKHRMLESHACEGLEDAKKAERDRNREKLEGERTVMLRGI